MSETRDQVEAAFAVSGTGTAAGRMTVRVAVYRPGVAPVEYRSPVVAIFSRDQTFVGVASSLVDDLCLDVDLRPRRGTAASRIRRVGAAVDVRVDLLPGTALDELPAWVWVAISALGFPVGLGTAALPAALVAATELVLAPVARTLVQARTMVALSRRLNQEVDGEIDRQIEEARERYGDAVTDDIVADLRASIWFEPQAVEIDSHDVAISGFGGVWNRIVQLYAASCTLDSRQARRSVDFDASRSFERAVATPELAPWMDAYQRHRPELRRLLVRHPAIMAGFARFVRDHRRTADAPDTERILQRAVADWCALSAEARQHASRRWPRS